MTVASSPYIIPFFISHQGCPHQCVFCNQEVITGEKQGGITGKTVKRVLEQKFAEFDVQERAVEVAFYGGSFTGLPMKVQEDLLGAVKPFWTRGKVGSIRLSTRPDYINGKRAAFLRAYGVGTVELGVQSLDAEVIAASGRGHTGRQVEEAFTHLKKEEFRVGGQLMVGLPGDSHRRAMESCRRLADFGPDMVRIYPVLVLEGSPLAGMYQKGRYTPFSLTKALALTAKMKMFFDRLGIPVIRMGLQPCRSLENELVAGPYHPAFGELVKSRLFFCKMRKLLAATRKPAVLTLSTRDESLFRGQKNCSVKRLEKLDLLQGVRVNYKSDQARGVILVEPEL